MNQRVLEILSTALFLIISYINIILIYKRLTNSEVRFKKRNIVLFIILIIIGCINSKNVNVVLKNSILLIVEFLIINSFYIDGKVKKLVGTMLIWSSINLFDFLISILILNFNTISYVSFILQHQFMSVMYGVLLLILLNIFISIPPIKFFLSKFIEFFSNNRKRYFYVATFVMFSIAHTTINVVSLNVKNVQLLLSLLMISFISLTTLLLKVIEKHNGLLEINNNLTETNDYYSKKLVDFKTFKHNYRYQLMAIRNIGSNEVKELIDIQLQEAEDDIKYVEGAESLPESIRGIIWQKLSFASCNKINIKLVNDLEEDFIKNLSIKKYNDLCLALGICLDNALEAALNTNKPELLLEISKKDEIIKISLYNNFSNILDLEEFGTREYSTKNRDSGYGVYSLKKLKTLDIKNKIYNDLFITIISI